MKLQLPGPLWAILICSLFSFFLGLSVLLWPGNLAPVQAQGLTPNPFGAQIPSVAPLPLTPSPTTFRMTAPTPFATLIPGVIPTDTPRFSPTPTVIPGDHLWFWRPFERDFTGQINDSPARGYAYGSNASGSLQLHHGLDYQNTTGTPVLSIGSGRVFYAGPDIEILFGPRGDFYGNLVVIEHDFLSPGGERIYSLYGHLLSTLVAAGDTVGYGTVIGQVGSEGVALGPHLHLEIRLGDPFSYGATVNPELWILPWEDYGIFAARVIGPDGRPAQNVRLELIGGGAFIAGTTYADSPVNSDPFYGENIVIGDLRAGEYDLKVGEIRNIVYRDKVYIEPGRVNMVIIQLPALPTPIPVNPGGG